MPREFETAALDYAAQGIEVFPLKPRTKIPLTSHGMKDATADPAQIREWWKRWPTANIAIRPAEGLIVLDVDPRSGGTLEALGALPDTWTARTGGGGWHVWMRYPDKTRAKVAGCPGVDIKTHLGYLVAPPSIHPDGGIYAWLNDAPIVKLPNHLRNRVRALTTPLAIPADTQTGTNTGNGLAAWLMQAVEGERNRSLHWAACRALETETAAATLAEVVDAARRIGLSDREIENTVRSAQRSIRR
ncbi:bifunctional DNA primase/polymerase [Nocardia brasiliensis]|uniref:bifunctional DNA primase/polymerase n=1 Tax=Nocardia brasiliensis TaxID=37326 RepID=UPI003CC7EE21